MATNSLQELYDQKYIEEKGQIVDLRPDAWTTSRYDDVARLLRDNRCRGALLEVGCGSGGLLLALADQFDQLTGVDLSNARIATALKVRDCHPELAKKVQFRVLDADSRLPFDDASFDCVVICAVLEHVIDVFGVMDEIARVCKTGGCVVVTVPNICYVKRVTDLLIGRVPLTGSPNRDIKYWRENGWDGAHFHYFSRSTLDVLLHEVGFAPVQWTGDGKLAKLRRWYINLVGNITVCARRV